MMAVIISRESTWDARVGAYRDARHDDDEAGCCSTAPEASVVSGDAAEELPRRPTVISGGGEDATLRRPPPAVRRSAVPAGPGAHPSDADALRALDLEIPPARGEVLTYDGRWFRDEGGEWSRHDDDRRSRGREPCCWLLPS